MKLPTPVLGMLEIAFNRALQLDEEALERFIALQGKVIGIELQGLGVVFYLLPTTDGVVLSADHPRQADVFLRGKPFSLLHTAATSDRSRLFDGDVSIEGDAELGQKVQQIFQFLDIDIEEQLARVVGDVAAHQLGSIVRSVNSFFSNAAGSFFSDLSEYLTEESRDLVSRNEMQLYFSDVDVVTADVERLQQRVQRLQMRIGEDFAP